MMGMRYEGTEKEIPAEVSLATGEESAQLVNDSYRNTTILPKKNHFSIRRQLEIPPKSWVKMNWEG